MAGFVSSQLIRLGGNLILTRLLVPEMFGVMAIVTVLIAGVTLFSDIGLLQNIVRSKRGDDPVFLNTAWSVQILRGFLISLLALFLSWALYYAGTLGLIPENSTYSEPILPYIIAVMAITPIIAGFNSTKYLVASRKLQLGRVTIIELSSQAIGLTVMIVWAFFEQTIWLLVVGSFISITAKMILTHLVLKGVNNRFAWDKDAFHEIFHFGKWIFISSILGFILSKGDKLLLGGLISSEMLGIYTIAYFLAFAAIQALSKLCMSVFFPALSEVVRERPNDLKKVYYKIRTKIDAIAFLVAGLLFMSGDLIIQTLYDERYYEAGWMLEYLSISIIGIGYVLSSQTILALGDAKIISVINFFHALAVFLLIPVLFHLFGIAGAIWAIPASSLVRIAGMVWYFHKHNLLVLFKEIQMVPMFLLGSGVGWLATILFSTT